MTGRLAALAALALGLLAAPAPRAEVAVEYYDAQGRAIRAETLYPAHRALYLATETGRAATRPARREATLAWLETLGMRVEEVGPARDGSALIDRALAWVGESAGEPDSGLLVIVDSALTEGPSGLLLGRGPGVEDAPFEVARLMAALDRTPARHVLVVFTDTPGVSGIDWGRPAPSLPPGAPTWLTPETARLARQALVPWSADLGVLGLLVGALSQDPDLASGRPGAFDPDAFLTARDLSRLSPGLALWSFGTRDAGGDFVLARREVPETRFDGTGTAREAYAAIRFDDEPQRLEAFLSRSGEGRWQRAAALQLRLQETRRRQAAGEACDEGLDFVPGELLGLNAGVLGRLDAFASTAELAASWLAAIRAASGIGPMRLDAIRARCREAETRPDFAPERALSLAVLDRAGAPAFAIAAAVPGGWRGGSGAAVLAGLHLLAEGPPPGGPAAVLAAVDAAAASGDGAARLVRALTLFEGAYRARAPEEAMAELAAAGGSGVALADALAAAVALSPHPVLAGWRAMLEPDREAAFAALRRARAAGVAIAPPVLDLDALEPERLADCAAALAGVDPRAALGPAAVAGLAAFEALLNRPEEALAPLTARVSPAGVAAACGRLPERGELAASLAPQHDALVLRLALLDIAEGRAGAAAQRLATLPEPSAEALFAAALASEGDRARALEPAAAAGHPLAVAAIALAAAERGQAEGLARLRAMADAADGQASSGLAEALLAGLRLSQARLAPGADRSAADRALVEGVLRVAAARARGVDLRLAQEDIARLATRAPGMLGFGLAEIGPAHRRLLGAGLPAGGGAVVLAAAGAGSADGADALAPGDVILAVGGQPVRSLAETEYALFAQLYGAVLQGRAIALEVAGIGGSGRRTVSLAPPSALADVPVPAALR